MQQAGEALEADFQRVYGLDLRDLWRGRLSPRRAGVLAAHLPMGSQVYVELGMDLAWTPEAHNIAHVADAVHAGNWQRGGGKGEKPKPLPRPAEMAERVAAEQRHVDRARRFLARQRKG